MFFCHHNHESDNNAEQGQAPSHCGHYHIKKIIPLFLIVLIIFFSVWSIESIVNAKARSKEIKNMKPEKTITVSAEGRVVASPDMASVNFSVITEAKTAKEVREKNTVKMNSVIEYVKGIGIDPKDIKTTSYYLYPKYDYPNGRSILTGYTLTNSINIKVRDFSVLGDLIAKSVDLGINQIGDVQFSIENPDDSKAQAGAIAMKNAREKAKRLADQAEVRLGKIVTFSESSSEYPTPYYYAKAEGLGMGGEAPQIEQGSQEVRVVANIIFEIE